MMRFISSEIRILIGQGTEVSARADHGESLNSDLQKTLVLSMM